MTLNIAPFGKRHKKRFWHLEFSPFVKFCAILNYEPGNHGIHLNWAKLDDLKQLCKASAQLKKRNGVKRRTCSATEIQ